jgi:hypothetical protein
MANCVWLRRGKVQRIEWEELSSASSKQSSMRISDEIRWDEFYMLFSSTTAYENELGFQKPWTYVVVSLSGA